MRTHRIGIAAGLLAATLHASCARAQEAPPLFSFSGFGTLGVIRSDNDKADYLVDAFRPDGPGHSNGWSVDADTRIGLQLTTNLGARLSAVVQVVAEQRYDDTFRPALEWANLKLQITPDLSVRAGRVVLPIFMATDSRKVGYANPWVRPPVEVYSLVPVTNNDGIDAIHHLALGDATNTFQLSIGRSDSKFPGGAGLGPGMAKVRDLVALVDTLERGFFTARVNYGQARLTIDQYAPLSDALRMFGPQGAALADKYGVDNKRVDFIGFSAAYDPGTWFAMGEWAGFDTRSVIGKKSAWYGSGGYRFGKATPYVTYARMKSDGNTSDPGLSLAGLPPDLAAIGAQVNAALNAQLGAIPVQSTVSAGVRWDFMRNAALKLQYDRVSLGSSSHGTFGNVQPGFGRGGRVQLFSAAVDFVF
jgi:Gram-negative porin